MIKANELRLGNKVYGGYPARSIATILTIIQQGIDAEYQLISYGAALNNPGIGSAKYEDIYPIPLTPEILERSGFNLADHLSYKGLRLSLKFARFDPAQGLLQVDSPFGTTMIQSLHHLQNWFFTLTGEELEVKL